ncbi:beta-galactosidase [Streptomyces sp. SHP 1-2]|uniref:beta-galactosidase n=1 Tax=Streptomyces sp. SHP 1-2 TaxID=2769489 RepID=UPI0022391222|nr:beta-galactosidase [Streptomyces sp. SHP 1-2]MCW5249054.1 beta-galactosidase [Streptomyces sp. SHP 1-2]
MELSRRVFSTLAGTTALGLALGGSAGGADRPAATAPGPVPTGPPPAPPAADGARHRVGFDRHSLLVDGRRLTLWSGETHPFRLPSPSLWRDVLQKMRAHGHNAVTVPLAWNLHSPAPGVHDFTGVRDLDLFLRTAAETGLYVVLRPGPFPVADGGGTGLDAGGLPGWLGAAEGDAARADAAYLRHADAWLSRVDAIAARHLFTRGDGTLLLYRLDPVHRGHLAHLHRKVRADGIDVPLPHGGRPLPDGEVERAPDAAGARRAHLDLLGRGAAVHTVRTAFGGTSWGWLPAPSAPAPTYDPTAGIAESRVPTARLAPLHQIGHLLRHVPDLTRLREGAGVRAADPRLRVRHLVNPDTGAHAYVLRNDSAGEVTSAVPMGGDRVEVTVPAHDARLLATGLDLGSGRRLAYATVQPMLVLGVGRLDIAVFTGRAGEMARLVVDCPSEPWPTRVDDEAAWAYDRGRLHVTVSLGEDRLTRVRVRGGDSERTLVLLFADEAASLRLWPFETPTGKGLVHGPALLREAALDGPVLRLTGDTVGEADLEVWAPRGVTGVTWNGADVATSVSRAHSLLATWRLPGAPELVLPALDGWRRRTENPEAEPGYDDSGWTAADRRTSYSTTPVPRGGPVLFADDYGYFYGDVWYRARLEGGAAGLGAVSLTYATGAQGMLMAWLDGRPLGTHRTGRESDGRGTWTGTARFPLPGALRDELRARQRRFERDRERGRGGRAPEPVLSVLVRRTQHDPADHRAGRGLVSAAFEGASPRARWRLRGTAAPDPVRGPLNHGGLYGESRGWHLPGLDDGGWEPAALPRADRRQGVTWYRTSFRLDVPPEVDASVGLVLDDDPARRYRAQIFLNGWNLGQYVNDAPPEQAQHTFVLPGGVLRTRAAANTLALAVLADGDTASGPGTARLELLGCAAGGVPVTPVPSPGARGS